MYQILYDFVFVIVKCCLLGIDDLFARLLGVTSHSNPGRNILSDKSRIYGKPYRLWQTLKGEYEDYTWGYHRKHLDYPLP